jgi:hypothetical protein
MKHSRPIRRFARAWGHLGAWACLISASILAQQAPQAGMTMHRNQAGTPNQNGWYDATSTEGHFSVSLPIPFNDFTVRAREKDGREVVTYVIGSKSKKGFKFSATEFPNESMTRPFDLKGYPEKLKASKKNTVSNERFFQFDGHSAVQFQVTDSQNSAFMRAVVSRAGVFILIVEYPTKSEPEALPLVEPFLNSLKIL